MEDYSNERYSSSNSRERRWEYEQGHGDWPNNDYGQGDLSAVGSHSRGSGIDTSGDGRDQWTRGVSDVQFNDAEERRRHPERNNRGKGPRNYKRSDSRISDEINDLFSDDPYLDASGIEVSVKDGEVILTGTVDDRVAKKVAEDIAVQVSGVSQVENRLRVEYMAHASTAVSK